MIVYLWYNGWCQMSDFVHTMLQDISFCITAIITATHICNYTLLAAWQCCDHYTI